MDLFGWLIQTTVDGNGRVFCVFYSPWGLAMYQPGSWYSTHPLDRYWALPYTWVTRPEQVWILATSLLWWIPGVPKYLEALLSSSPSRHNRSITWPVMELSCFSPSGAQGSPCLSLAAWRMIFLEFFFLLLKKAVPCFLYVQNDFIFYLCGCVSEGVYVHVCVRVRGGQKRELDLGELELQVVVSHPT